VKTESKPSLWTPPATVRTGEGDIKKADASTPPEPAQESEEAVWSTIATTSQTTQAVRFAPLLVRFNINFKQTEKETSSSAEPIAAAANTPESGDVKQLETKEAVSNGQVAATATVPGEVKKIEAKDNVLSGQDDPSPSKSAAVTKAAAQEPVPSANIAASGDVKKVETKEAVLSKPDSPTTAASSAPAVRITNPS
jgi:hypothetical protein